MDTETNHSNAGASGAAAASSTDSSANAASANATSANTTSSAAASAPTMDELLSESPIPCGICRWITCMRKAGIALNYTMEKRHIPDMNQEAKTSSPTSKPAPASGASAFSAGAPTKGSMDAMTISGVCRIRYFDLALGAMALLSASILLKCCCRMKRHLF